MQEALKRGGYIGAETWDYVRASADCRSGSVLSALGVGMWASRDSDVGDSREAFVPGHGVFKILLDFP